METFADEFGMNCFLSSCSSKIQSNCVDCIYERFFDEGMRMSVEGSGKFTDEISVSGLCSVTGGTSRMVSTYVCPSSSNT